MVGLLRNPTTPPARSLAKTITWRLVAALDTFAISYMVTGSFGWAGSIVGIEAATKMVLYYAHERVWSHVPWLAQPPSA
jgi:uncharacterized membrane protein